MEPLHNLQALDELYGPTPYDDSTRRLVDFYLSRADLDDQARWQALINYVVAYYTQCRHRPFSRAMLTMTYAEENLLFLAISSQHLRYYNVEVSRHAALDGYLKQLPNIVAKLSAYINLRLGEVVYEATPEMVERCRSYLIDFMLVMDMEGEAGRFTSN